MIRNFSSEQRLPSAGAVVRRVQWENAPGNNVFDVVVFEGPDMLAEFEFRGVSVISVAEWCCVVSASCFEVVPCESNVLFCPVVVFACDGGLVDYWWLKAVFVQRACVLLSPVACTTAEKKQHFSFICPMTTLPPTKDIDTFRVLNSKLERSRSETNQRHIWLVMFPTTRLLNCSHQIKWPNANLRRQADLKCARDRCQ